VSAARPRPTCLAALLLGAIAAAAPEGELIREESFNFRIRGKLPPGWTQRADTLAFSYAIDGIPHAYVHFVRQRLDGEVDPGKEVAKREPHYRFPGAPNDAEPRIGVTDWGGRTAALYEFETTVQGVVCRRRVTALFARPFWYELIETVYGEKTPEDEGCRAGLAVFRRGFRILARPPTEEEKLDVAERTIEDRELGFSLLKPAGFRQVEVDPGADPGCRVAFEARSGKPGKHVRVRFFEYGAWRAFDARQWMDIFFTGFSNVHRSARREPATPHRPRGAQNVVAETFLGTRDDHTIRTLVILATTRKGRVFALRFRTQDGAEEDFSSAIQAILKSVELSD
jgi:hypothetical protein